MRVTADSRALAEVLVSSPGAAIGCYEGWTVVDLAGHVGRIHRWVTDVVVERATSRPTTPYATPPPTRDLPAWLQAGARDVVAALGAAGADEEVWTISRHHHDVAFWRRRMVLETALHRWDAEDAVDREPRVDPAVARAGVAETLDVYLAQRLEGREVGGSGQRVTLAPVDGDGWTVTLRADGVEVTPAAPGAGTVVQGDALALWLLLTCRRGLDAVEVSGDRTAAELLVDATHLVPGPAG